MASNQKDTIYIDIDDEITGIIDKVRSSEQRIVALVLPKRAAVLQSIVNMKLLKRTAEQAKKHVVLITSEAGLLPLAGAVGIHVAPSLQSKPSVPEAHAAVAPDTAADEDDDFDSEAFADKPVGQLAGPAAFAAADEGMETIELDNEPAANQDTAGKPFSSGASPTAGGTAGAGFAGVVSRSSQTAKPKNKKLKIPNFNKFRLWLVLGILVVIGLAVFGYVAAFVLPKATVTLVTDSSDITTNESVTLDPGADELDLDNRVLPAKIATKQQTATQQVMTSGKKNNGEKASGEVKIINCSSGDSVTIPAGTGLSADGKTYITQSSLTLPVGAKGCKDFPGVTSDTVKVIAQSPGADYNIEPTTFAVANSADDSYDPSNLSAKSEDPMTGGTDNIVRVVSQSDIDTAKQKLTASSTSSVKSDLVSELKADGYMAVQNSVQSGDVTVTPSAQVGDVADTVTVTSSQTFTMYGVKQSDVRDLIMDNAKGKIDTRKQKVLSDGAAQATFDITSPASHGALQATLSATTLAGPEIHEDQLKSQIAGKKTNDVRTIATATPGITDVSVNYSPFWVSKVPKNTDKITIVIKKANATTDAKNSNP